MAAMQTSVLDHERSLNVGVAATSLRLHLLQLVHEPAQRLDVNDPDLLQHARAEPQLHAYTQRLSSAPS